MVFRIFDLFLEGHPRQIAVPIQEAFLRERRESREVRCFPDESLQPFPVFFGVVAVYLKPLGQQ